MCIDGGSISSGTYGMMCGVGDGGIFEHGMTAVLEIGFAVLLDNVGDSCSRLRGFLSNSSAKSWSAVLCRSGKLCNCMIFGFLSVFMRFCVAAITAVSGWMVGIFDFVEKMELYCK